MGCRAMKPQVAVAAFTVFVAGIVLANWAITTYGLVWVAPGLVAPAGVYFAAITFPARDVLQRASNKWESLLAIAIGAGVSYLVSSSTIATASALTFLCSETLDFVIYTPLQRRWFTPAVVASGICAAALDSWIFLRLAGFGESAFWGTFVGKLWVVCLVGGPVAFGLRWRLTVTQ